VQHHCRFLRHSVLYTNTGCGKSHWPYRLYSKDLDCLDPSHHLADNMTIQRPPKCQLVS